MRQIKFRGKSVNGQWRYGNLAILKKDISTAKAGSYISNSVGLPFAFQVIPETVGQFIGLTDKHGKKIYEGDIVYSLRSGNRGEVFWHPDRVMFCVDDSETDIYIRPYDDWIDYNVVGNIHDKPEDK